MKHPLAYAFTCKIPGLIALSTLKAGTNIPTHPARPGPWIFREALTLNERAIANLKIRGYHVAHSTITPVDLPMSA